MRRLIKWLIILGAVIGGIAYGVSIAQQRFRAPPTFRTAKVAKGRIEWVVNSTGTVKPVQSVSVGAIVSGPIAEIKVDYNDRVAKGQLLAKIDPRLLNAAVERDKAALKTQQAELARIDALLQQATNNEERAYKLWKINKDYVSDTEMDQYKFAKLSLKAQRQLAEAQISQAEASLERSKTDLGYTDVKSPVDGIVIERKVDTGQTMAATFQTPEMFIIAPDMEKHMHVHASVDEADIGNILAAQEREQRINIVVRAHQMLGIEAADLAQRAKTVKFSVDAFPNELFEGKIYQVRMNATTTSNVVTYPVVITVANPQLKLRPSMTANISFLVEAKENVVRIPAAALRYYPLPAHVRPEDRPLLEGTAVPATNNQEQELKPSATEKVEASRKRFKRVVWIKDPEGELLRAVPVTLGLYDNQWAELIEGNLTEGQEVVTGLGAALPPAATR